MLVVFNAGYVTGPFYKHGNDPEAINSFYGYEKIWGDLLEAIGYSRMSSGRLYPIGSLRGFCSVALTENFLKPMKGKQRDTHTMSALRHEDWRRKKHHDTKDIRR